MFELDFSESDNLSEIVAKINQQSDYLSLVIKLYILTV